MMRVLGHSPCAAPNTHTPHPSPFLCFHPTPLHWDFLLSIAKLPISTCMIIEHSDLHTGKSSGSSFGRRKVSALEGVEWKVNEAVVSLLSNLIQLNILSFQLFWLCQCVLTLTLWSFPPCNSVHCKDGRNIRVGQFLRKCIVVYSIHYPFSSLFKELFSSLYFLCQNPRS